MVVVITTVFFSSLVPARSTPQISRNISCPKGHDERSVRITELDIGIIGYLKFNFTKGTNAPGEYKAVNFQF